MTNMTRRQEAALLASRLGLSTKATLAWMNAKGLDAITDLIGYWPDLDHGAAMNRAADEIWAFVMGGGASAPEKRRELMP